MEKGKSYEKVEYNGNIFKSISELARFLGVSRQAVHVAIGRGNKVKGHHVKRAD